MRRPPRYSRRSKARLRGLRSKRQHSQHIILGQDALGKRLFDFRQEDRPQRERQVAGFLAEAEQ